MNILNRTFKMVAAASVALVLFGTNSALAKKPPSVQFVNVAPLPGAGTALNADGQPDGRGAMQINIPVAYTPGNGFVSAGLFEGQYTHNYSTGNFGNGTGTLAFGFFKWPRFYASAMAVSSIIFNDSKVVSGQLQVVEETARVPAVAFGAQDILNKERQDMSANTGISYYGVMTKGLVIGKTKVYGTLGYGAARFEDTVFYGVSCPISDQFTLSAENDGFQFNTGLGWRPWGRYSPVTFLAGYNAKAGALVGAQATGKMSNYWAIPIAILFMRR